LTASFPHIIADDKAFGESTHILETISRLQQTVAPERWMRVMSHITIGE
jgi:hypothetical protein